MSLRPPPRLVEVGDGCLELIRGEATAADAIVTTDHGTLLALSHRRLELPEALDSGELEIDGDEQVVARFLGLFPLPEPAATASAA